MPGLMEFMRSKGKTGPVTAGPADSGLSAMSGELVDALRDPLAGSPLTKDESGARARAKKGKKGGKEAWDPIATERAERALDRITVEKARARYPDIFRAYLMANFMGENIQYLDACDAHMDRDTMISTFIALDGKTPINVSGSTRDRILAGTLPPDAGYDEVVAMLNKDVMRRFSEDPGVIKQVAEQM
ncbi:MAG TPA: hypothetical protein PKA64_24620 [Myxococcota bacterium]|nr:hypothetical protein [Myxococcota bacterium]